MIQQQDLPETSEIFKYIAIWFRSSLTKLINASLS